MTAASEQYVRLAIGEILVFYLPISFFYYLAKLIIFTKSSRIPCIFMSTPLKRLASASALALALVLAKPRC